MYKPIPNEQWLYSFSDIPMVLDLASSDLPALKSRFKTDDATQKGPLIALFENHNGFRFGLSGPADSAEKGIKVHIRPGTPNLEDRLLEILDFLELDLSDCQWIQENLNWTTAPKIHLCRFDDNGNDFIMATFSTLSKAEKVRLIYERKGHKQTYFLQYPDGSKP